MKLGNFDTESLNIVCLMRHGSHLYGLNTPNSDVDYKGVYIPDPVEAMLGLSKDHITVNTSDDCTKNTKDDTDITLYSIGTFVKMLIEGETIAIDMIHCNEENLIETSKAWDSLVQMRSLFYTKHIKAFMGYVKKQAHKYGVRGSRINSLKQVISVLKPYKNDKLITGVLSNYATIKDIEFVELHGNHSESKSLMVVAGSKYYLNTPIKLVLESLEKKLVSYGKRAEEAANNEGVDWKAVSHAIRAGYQLEEIFTTGDLKYPLKDRKYLLSVKKGERDFSTEVAVELERITQEIEKLVESSSYPDQVDQKLVWSKLYDILKDNM